MNIYGPFFTDLELGINDSTPQDIRKKLFLLVKFGLNPVRAKFGPIQIDSGYRSLEHNAVVGGVTDSQHCTGEAVDFKCKNLASQRDVFEYLRPWWPGQCFFYQLKGHIHLSLPTIELASKSRLYSLVFSDK